MLQDRQQRLTEVRSQTSSPDADPAGLTGTARVGAELRATRQRLGWSLPDLADSLRIRQPYLEAIEDGRLASLPGNTYAFGFIRAYGNALGLAGDEYARRFRAEAGTVRRPELAFPVPVPQRGVPAGAVVLLGMVLVAAAYGGWYYTSADQRTPSHIVPPLPERLAPLASGAAPQNTPSPQVASILPSVAPPLSPSLPAVTVSPARPVAPDAALAAPAAATSPPAAMAKLADAPAAAQGPASSPASAAPQTTLPPAGSPVSGGTATATPPATSPPAAAGIVLKASADSWVMVKQNGKVLLNRTLHAGDTWPLPADGAGATLTTGNAGAVLVSVDGVDTPALGATGAVRRDVSLDPAGLRSGHPASAPPAKSKPHARPPTIDETDRLNAAEAVRKAGAGGD